MSGQISLVDYLVLGDEPHLVVHQCTTCDAQYFDRRNACASCGATDFAQADVATEGTVTTFTIVSMAAKGIPVPFAAAVIDCNGTAVRGNIIGIELDPDHIHVGLKVRLVTMPIGEDSAGTEAVGFAFQPLEGVS